MFNIKTIYIISAFDNWFKENWDVLLVTGCKIDQNRDCHWLLAVKM